jgi:hypothetical protein
MKHTITLFCLIFNLLGTAQNNTITTGGSISSSDGSISYSVGQIFYKTQQTLSSNYIVEGLQQSFNIVVLDNENFNDIMLTTEVFPNPTKSNLYLNTNSYDISDLSYEIYNVSGKILQNKTGVTEKITTINLNHQSAGIYFLYLIKNNEKLKTFKIIKN